MFQSLKTLLLHLKRQLFVRQNVLQNSPEGATSSPSLNTYQYLNNRKFDFLSDACPS